MSTHEPAAPKTKKAAIDWRTVHQRLAAASAAVERMEMPNAEETRRILKTRAHALAREPAKTQTAAESLEVVEFLLAYEKYAIESRYVREVYPLEDLTPLPCAPAFVLGIVSVRGEIISVINIKKFFDLPEKGLTNLNQVIVLQSQAFLFASARSRCARRPDLLAANRSAKPAPATSPSPLGGPKACTAGAERV